jgi:hypothetical protein
MIEEDEAAHYTLETPDGEKAVELLSASALCTGAQYDGVLSFDAVHDSVPEIVALLCREGVRVYGLARQKKSLEDTFLEMTDTADVGTQPVVEKQRRAAKGGEDA